MRRHSPCFIPKALTTGIALSLSSSLYAQTAEEIIVTADFRQASLQTLPGSISVIDAGTIAEQNARHLEEVLGLMPNVNYASGASRARFYQVRGIGERSQYGEPLISSVGLLIDGVDFSGIGTVGTLYDMEQVEVLMGPQGTRYGSNALAGLVNLRSKTPTTQFSAGLQAGVGNQDTRELAGFVSGPLGDSLLYRISAQQYESDGFNHNLTLDRASNQRDEQTLRGKLSWQIDQDASLDLSLSLIDIDNGYDAFSLDNTRDTLSDQPGFDRQQSRAFSAAYRRDMGDLSLELIASSAESDIDYGYDEDWAYVGLHPWEYSSTDWYFRERDNDSLELRLLSDTSGDFSWVTGLYRLEQDVSLERVYTYLNTPFTSDYSLERTAAYIDSSTRLGERLSLDAGLRAERFSGHYSDSDALAFRPADTLFGGRLALRFQADDDSLLFTGVSRGYKTGGFNTDGSLDASLREFAAEYLWNYEVGIKRVWPQRKLSVQATLFWMDREDVQVSSFASILRNDGSTEFFDYTGNAAAGFNRGLETSLQWQPGERFSLAAALGLLDSEYEDFINSNGDNLDGREQAHAPSYQYSLTAAWQFSPSLAGSMTLAGRDAFYFSDSHDNRSEAYATLNAELSWQRGDWSLRVWGRNLSDEDYFVRGFYFGNDPRDGYTPKSYTQLGENRRVGVTVEFALD